jgi:hypothetical protein
LLKRILLKNSSRPQKNHRERKSKSKDDVMKSSETFLIYCLLLYFRSSRIWLEEEREQLIAAVKNYPCLYYTTSKTYKDITVKTNAKVEISKLFESCSAEDVTFQWGTFVDKFRRTRKQYNNEDATGTFAEDSMSQYPHWDLYQSMLLLEKHIKQRT